MKGIALALFDLDNTLILRVPGVEEAVYAMLSERGVRPDRGEIARANAKSELWQGRQIMRENAGAPRMDDGEFLENIVAVYREALMLGGSADEAFRAVLGARNRTYRLMDGALDALDRLRARDIAVGVVSNNASSVRAALDEFGISPRLSCCVISEEVGVQKPDPRILAIACDRAGVPPARAVYVGDHPFDVLCAHAAGMPAIWLPPNPFFEIPEEIEPPEHTVRSLADACDCILKAEQQTRNRIL